MDRFLALVGVTLLPLLLIYKLFQKAPTLKFIPGPRGFPLVGSALQIDPKRVHHQFYDMAKLYGKIFKIRILDTNTVVLNDREFIQKAFASEGQFFNNRPNLFVMKHIGLLDSISMRHLDKEHGHARKVFVKHLHFYGSGITKFENNLQGEINRLLKSIDSQGDNEFEVSEMIKRSIMNVIAILLIGKEATTEDVKNFATLTEGGDFFMNALTNTLLSNMPFLLYLPFYKRRMESIIMAKQALQDKYFNEAKETTPSNMNNGIVHDLLQERDENKLPDEIIKSMILTDVLSAGVLTTSSLLPFIILCLVNHPEYQRRLQTELDSVIGKVKQPSLRDKQECVFLEAVAMEAARLISPGPFWLPHFCKEDRDFEGFHVKANTQVLANAWFIHHDESIWGDPWNFRPDRFLDNDGNLLPNDHKLMKNWIPFGVGLRRCPGMGLARSRIFLFVSNIFQRYTLEPVPGKCGSCDPRTDDFIFETFVKTKHFYCVAKRRNGVSTI